MFVYKIGDRVEFEYKGLIGEGVIRKIKSSLFFQNKYLISAYVNRRDFLGYKTCQEECFWIKEESVLNKI